MTDVAKYKEEYEEKTKEELEDLLHYVGDNRNKKKAINDLINPKKAEEDKEIREEKKEREERRIAVGEEGNEIANKALAKAEQANTIAKESNTTAEEANTNATTANRTARDASTKSNNIAMVAIFVSAVVSLVIAFVTTTATIKYYKKTYRIASMPNVNVEYDQKNGALYMYNEGSTPVTLWGHKFGNNKPQQHKTGASVSSGKKLFILEPDYCKHIPNAL